MSVPGPTLGPCEAWIDAADVAACCTVNVGSDTEILEIAAFEASMALFEISGRQFPGLCDPVTVRPCRTVCSCWGDGALGLGQWYWSNAWYGGMGPAWHNECGDRCGCGRLSRVKLAGYPVREILEVTIDGDVVPADEYRLDGWRWLTRLDDPGPPARPRFWPSCQNLALDDGPGTFTVSYRYGQDPPELARRAAAVLACQLAAACVGDRCKLPTGAVSVERQGIKVNRGVLTNWFDPSQSTGLVAVDLFLKAYWPNRRGRRPAVWSPDVQQFAQRFGS